MLIYAFQDPRSQHLVTYSFRHLLAFARKMGVLKYPLDPVMGEPSTVPHWNVGYYVKDLEEGRLL